MFRTMLGGKIHRATVTEADLNYVGSITVDQDLLDAAGICVNEKVAIVNNNNGERLETYTIPGERGSGVVCLNGAAARLVQKGDIVIIMSYVMLSEPEIAAHEPKVVLVDENNEIVASQTIESTLPSILPGQSGRVTARLPLPAEYRSNDSAQKLTAAIRVVNPLPNGAPVAFANKAMNKPLPGYLELGKLVRGRAPKN